ncbi:peptidoglycan DD-metalloendopeptidase family protein [Bacillus mangrovi]|uniref:Peptidoglycan DD-metalloendopeptidase family protein n=1 Tax=Metabacillus mangrovi TaxID=1491830 RepID=A0A7X2V4T3_9BACI|nr:peptidoglycan DD-metalloendopeptidase family protein [Metabacillus mangrovi]MTH53730.1 peptidoglycan DD-metalloendopeptidase family protein [Metabacillus mangrovi]
MKRKLLTFGVAAVISVNGVLIPLTGNQASAETLEEKQRSIQEQKSGVQNDLTGKQKQIEELTKKQDELNSEIKRLDSDISAANAKIREKQDEISAAKKDIENLKKEIKTVKERIKERNEIVRDRARALQESGGMGSYLDVLLGAQDFGDFISRIGAVSTIIGADKDILKAHDDDKKLLEQKEAELNQTLQGLQSSLTELESIKEGLNKKSAEKNAVMQQVMQQNKDAEAEMFKLEDEAAFLKEQEAAVQQEMVRAKEEEEKRKREAAEAAARAAEQKEKQKAEEARQSTPPASSSSSGSGTTATPAPAPAPTGNAIFIWPASGRHSSEFGMRTHPITGQQKLHGGIDIANGNVPVHAAASGRVVRAGVASGWGNVVFITHVINGKTYTTIYGHLDSINVSSGQTVSQGQQIGIMGTTGASTGIHLHFEVHPGGYSGKGSADNPRKYLP